MVRIARPRGRIEVTCPNPDCSHFGREKGKDIVKKGKNRVGHQQYYCFHCKSFFVETKGTPLYHKHLSEKEVIKICRLLVEKNGIRSIERVTGHHRDTIGRLLEDLAAHAAAVNDYLLREVKLDEFEVDEMWATVKKNKRRLSPEARRGLTKAMPGCTTA